MALIHRKGFTFSKLPLVLNRDLILRYNNHFASSHALIDQSYFHGIGTFNDDALSKCDLGAAELLGTSAFKN